MATVPILDRKVSVESHETPNFQGTFQHLAESENNLSSIGSKVAEAANKQMAEQLGYEAGKNPKGDLFPAITDFDQHFSESYKQQAAATLSLQGQKLLDDAQVEMSKAPRLTPDLIAKTQNQLTVGLSRIAENAPTGVKEQLQTTFTGQIMEHTARYNNKMITQQREDQKDNLMAALDKNAQTVNEFALSGQFKNAAVLAKGTKAMAESAVATHFMTPERAQIYKDTIDQTALSGQYSYFAEQAYRSNTYDEFSKHYAEKKPEGMTNEQYYATGQAFQQHINFLKGMNEQYENLTSQKMVNRIATDPMAITGADLNELKSQVSPMKYEQVEYKYIQAVKAFQNRNSASVDLIHNFSNPTTWARAEPKVKNDAFLKSVDYAIQQSKDSGNPLSAEDAEVQVAAQAGGTVPVFIDELKNKLHSSNPAFIESAAKQIHDLEQMKAGHALIGLNDEDKALFTMYEALRDATDPVTAARDTSDAVLNQGAEVQKENQEKWSNLLSTETKGGKSHSTFALNTFLLKEEDFINPSTAQFAGSTILDIYKSNYLIANADNNVAKKLTQKYVNDNFGQTGVNGGSFTTMRPLEKVLGFQTSDGVPYIQQDVVNQLNQHFEPIKKLYDNKTSNEYWETLPLSDKTHGVFTSTYDPIQVKRHMRTPNGQVTDTYNIILQGNAFNWDVAVQTKDGMRNIFQKAPYLGILNYQPNAEAIRSSYMKDHSLTSTKNKKTDFYKLKVEE
jgi:hypothetical protein